MTTAEIAIVTTGAVGLASPAIAAGAQLLLADRTAQRERLSKDLDELRGLLDETTLALHRHTTDVVALEKWMQEFAFGLRRRTEEAPWTDATRQELYLLNARLIIRRGRNDEWLVRKLRECLELTDHAVEEIGSLWAAQEPFDYGDEQLQARANGYWSAYNDFVDVCKEIAGSTL